MNEHPRVGIGIDLHRLEPMRPCHLGGIEIECEYGPVGHSDADVILHAVCDACLGAAGLDDLGTLFSDRDPANAGRSSTEFCTEVARLLGAEGLRVASLDVVVECNVPKIGPHRAAIRARLAELFSVPVERTNVRGKTGEDVDAIGRGEAIRATCVVLLVQA